MAATELHESPLVSQLRAQLRKPKVGSATPSNRRRSLFPWWPHSTLRKMAMEIRNFPLRILASRQLPNWGLYRLPKTPEGLPPNSFLQSCSECIQGLQEEFPWVGYLDAEILARAYAEGSRWAFGNSCLRIETDKGS